MMQSNMEKYKDIEESYKEILHLENNFKQNIFLDIDELEKLFIFFQTENKMEYLEDSRFILNKFRHLYLTYASDLEFNSIFYKNNPEVKISEVIDVEYLKKINRKEFDEDITFLIQDLLIKNKCKIPIEKYQVENDKIFLMGLARDWAKEFLNERQKDEHLKIIATEARQSLKNAVKRFEKFLLNQLTRDEELEIFKAVLKNIFIYYEGKKIFLHYKKNQFSSFSFCNEEIHVNFYSIIHILNRHYGEMISTNEMIENKSFHNTKIDPYEMPEILILIAELINQKGIEKKINFCNNTPLLINYKMIDYAIFFKKYKYDNSKIILETFFPLDSKMNNAKNLCERIYNSLKIELNEDIIIYLYE
jgi:hypothetical protein